MEVTKPGPDSKMRDLPHKLTIAYSWQALYSGNANPVSEMTDKSDTICD